MSTGRWERLNELFHAATGLAPEERAAFLSRACGDDAELLREVERLVAADAQAGEFIEAPALASASWLDEAEEGTPPDRAFGPYRVIREIARGGMGTVYLAERADGQYERRVALKLIKRGMDLELVLRRFRAERQILASLEHPNIARLLDGGTTDDDRPYFVMEYIEGEPIDAYADARHLSVPERLRLFLQVCDAVAYAHGRRVVHRDIKPANILVTPEGVPKLLDFGIAKVLEAGSEEATSSVTGFRLLTPEYASPEQVDGRSATPASDIYSLGVVLYELLTGRSPYGATGRDPFAVAAAVRVTDPERPSAAVRRSRAELSAPAVPADTRRNGARARVGPVVPAVRQQLRGDLDAIVLTALRKEPERRYPSVERLAEDIRRHLEARPVSARPDTLAYRARKFERRNRAAVAAAGVTALAASLLLGGAFLAWRGDASAGPSLLEAGLLDGRDRILVADFTDRTGDTLLAAALTGAVRTDLAQSSVIQVLTPAQVRAALMRMGLAPGMPLGDSLAHEVAVREGAKAIVTGEVVRVGGAYTIAVQLLSAEEGEALATVRQSAADSTDLIEAFGRAGRALRRRIGESLHELRDVPPLEQVTTASLPALRKYTEGYRLFLDGERTRAVRFFEEAVAIDTGFAAAHRALASTYEALAEPGRSLAALQRAVAHHERLPFLEGRFLVAGHAYASGEYETAILAYDRVLERYPNNVPALNNQALAYRDRRQFAVAESLWHRAVELDSTIAVLYYGLHSAQALQGDVNASRRTLELIRRRFPQDPVLPVVEVQDAAARRAWDEAERLARTNLAAKGADTLQLVDAFEVLAGIVMTRGRLPEAERHWRSQLAVSQASESWGRHLFGVTQLALLEFRLRGRPDAARALVDSALARRPLEDLLPGDRPFHELARFYAAVGSSERARILAAAADANDAALGRRGEAERSWTRGVIALGSGRVGEATSLLRRAAETHTCEICPLPDLARAYEAAGDDEAAIATYERYVETPWLWRYATDALELGEAMKRSGELNERRGDRAKASVAYADLLDLWAAAEGEPARQADEVRRRLTLLHPS